MKKTALIATLALGLFAGVASASADKMEECEIHGKKFSVPAGRCEAVKGGDMTGLDAKVAEEIKGLNKAAH